VLIIHWHADVLGPGASPLLRLAYRAYRPLEQILLRRADVVITTSPDYLATSEPLRRWREKCVVIPLGLDPARVSIDRDCGYSPPWSQAGALKVLNVGRLAYYKGLGFLVEAVARTSGVELVLAGAGEERKSIESLVRARSLTTRVHLAGRLSDSERNRLMLACDVFCLPSINRNEAFGLVLLEAMALGRAAIVSRVPGSGMGWVVEDNRTGWHAVPGDIDSLANALSRARDNREMLDTMGKSARVRFMEHFDIRSVASRVTRIYQESA
jgi:rhamnosyl/mannosyltransferase